MRITDPNAAALSSSGEPSAIKSVLPTGGGGYSPVGSSSSSQDQVSLSGTSQLVRDNSTARTEKLTALSATVRSGHYDVPPAVLSGSLVTETLARSLGS